MSKLLEKIGQILVWQGRVFLSEKRFVFTADSVAPLGADVSVEGYDSVGDDFNRALQAAGVSAKPTSFGFTAWKVTYPERLFGSPIYFDGFLARCENRKSVVGWFRLDDSTRAFVIFAVNMAFLYSAVCLVTVIALSIFFGRTFAPGESPLGVLAILAGGPLLLLATRAFVELFYWFNSRQRSIITSALQTAVRE